MGRILYRYMPWDAFEKSIESWSLKATFPDQTNDLFEFLPQEMNDNSYYDEVVNTMRNDLVFISFSTKVSDCAMWGHYADQFRGVCMAFYFPNRGPITRVIYNNKRVNLNPSKIWEERAKDYRKIMRTKDTSWKSEKEWRWLLNARNATTAKENMLLYEHPMRYFVGVILGPKCTHTCGYVRQIIRNHLKEKDGNFNADLFFTVLKANPDKKTFNIYPTFWCDNMDPSLLTRYGYDLSNFRKRAKKKMQQSRDQQSEIYIDDGTDVW